MNKKFKAFGIKNHETIIEDLNNDNKNLDDGDLISEKIETSKLENKKSFSFNFNININHNPNKENNSLNSIEELNQIQSQIKAKKIADKNVVSNKQVNNTNPENILIEDATEKALAILNKQIDDSFVNNKSKSDLNVSVTQSNNSKKAFVKEGFTLDTIVKELTSDKKHVESETPLFEAEKENTNLLKLDDKEIKKLKFLALKEKVKDIEIKHIAQHIGAKNGEDKIRGKWKMPNGDNVSIRGQQWFNHNSNFKRQGGVGAISFAQYIMAEEYKYDLDNQTEARKAEARGIYWLAESFNVEEVDIEDLKAAKDDNENKIKASYERPPVLEHYNEKITNYLHNIRKLPLWIINEHLQKGDLYASLPSQFLNKIQYVDQKKIISQRDLHNLSDNEIYCVFNSGDAKFGSSECRVIAKDGPFMEKGFVAGSHKKSYNFMSIEEETLAERKIVLCEAAIDALSYRAMNPGVTVLSIGGVDNLEFTLKIVLDVLEHPTYSLVFAFDNDDAGLKFYNTVLEQIGKTKIDLTEEEQKRFVQQLIDNKKITKQTPENAKDWNEFLINNQHLIFDMESYKQTLPVIKKKIKTAKIQQSLTNSPSDVDDMKILAFSKNNIQPDFEKVVKNKM